MCLIFACSPQLLLIKVWTRDQQKKRHRVNKEGRELSKISQMLFILLCQYCHVIHYTPLWSETDECLQTIATPKDTANCCCAAIVFTATFGASLANWHSNKGHKVVSTIMWRVQLLFLIMEHDFVFSVSHRLFSLPSLLMPGLF